MPVKFYKLSIPGILQQEKLLLSMAAVRFQQYSLADFFGVGFQEIDKLSTIEKVR